MEAEGDAVLAKVNKISDIFSSLTDTVTRSSGLIIKEKLNNRQNAQAIKTQPQNSEEFYNRVSSFRPGLWTARELTPLECARWGWRIQEKDILQCVTCREVVCAILPDVQDFKAYEKYLGLLKTRIVEAHKDACGWKFNPSPEEFVQPPYIGSLEDMRNLTNSARTLAALNSALPYLDVQSLSDSLGADKDLIEGLFQNGSIDYEVQASSVLLVLSGWTRGEGAYLRCKVCRRSVGLWSFITRADELERTRAISPAPTPSGKRKRPGEEVEETVEEEGMEEDTSEEPGDAGIRICPPRKCKHLKTDNKGTDSEEKTSEEQETPGEDSAGKGEENVQSEQEEKMEEEDGDEEKENSKKEETLAKEAEREKTDEKEVKETIEEGSAQTGDDKEDKSRKELEGRKSEEKEEVKEGAEKIKDESQEEAREKNSSEEKENEAISSDNKESKKNEGEKTEQEDSDGKDECQAENKADEDTNEEDSKTSKENGNGEKMTKENKDEENEKTANSQSNSEEESQKPKGEEPQVSEEALKDGRKDSKKDTDTTTSQAEKDVQNGAKAVSEEKVEESPKDENEEKVEECPKDVNEEKVEVSPKVVSEEKVEESPKEVSEEKVEESPKVVSEEKVEESPKERNSAGDKEQGSSLSKGSSRVQASALLSPLIIGSSPSTQIRKIDKKQYFHPLEEHRHWCTWTMKILVEEIDEEMSIEKRGYQMVTEQARDILDFASRKDLCSSEKYIRNVEGLRSIRTMLNGLASVDAWLSEDIAEK